MVTNMEEIINNATEEELETILKELSERHKTFDQIERLAYEQKTRIEKLMETAEDRHCHFSDRRYAAWVAKRDGGAKGVINA